MSIDQNTVFPTGSRNNVIAILDNKLSGENVLHVSGSGARAHRVPRAQRRGGGRGRAALAVLRRLVLALPGTQGGHALLCRGR